MRKEIIRRRYLDRLLSVKDRRDTIKVISGIRRCGKTTLMKQFIDILRSEGVSDDNIIYMNFESLEFDSVKSYVELYDIFEKKLLGRKTYVFLDEVQMVKNWEKAVNSARIDFDADIYVTGSNAYLLSSELSTLLTGRTATVNMLPLSFKEFLELYPTGDTYADLEGRYADYVRVGAMPIIDIDDDPDIIKDMLTGILNTIINRDIATRNEIRDFTTLNNLVRFVLDNCGNTMSPASIAKELEINNPKLIDTYLTLLEQAYIVYKAKRYDIKGKKLLKTNAKYYCTDIGMRSAIIGYGTRDRGHVLENLIFLELVRRGFDVKVGAYGDKEIDFTASRGGDIRYYQVAWTLNESTEEREIGNLKKIADNYPKTVITTDRSAFDHDEGIRIVNYLDFLTEE
jgi:predicted AAA+ superfamily ATPase